MQILKYGAVRLAIFFAVFALCVVLRTGWLWAAVVATIVSFAVSYLVLNPMRLRANRELQNAWEGRRGAAGKTESEDADIEDSYTQGRFMDPAEMHEFTESATESASDSTPSQDDSEQRRDGE